MIASRLVWRELAEGSGNSAIWRRAGRVFCCSVTGEGSAETNGKICQSGSKGAALAAAP